MKSIRREFDYRRVRIMANPVSLVMASGMIVDILCMAAMSINDWLKNRCAWGGA